MEVTTNADPRVWFRALHRRRDPALALICLPHAGGGASMFNGWRGRLPSSIDVLAVQYPGHEGRWGARPCDEAPEIVEPLAAAIEAEVPGEYAFFGHSLGALLAFEVARELRRRTGREPLHLFVSGARAPDAPDPSPWNHASPDSEFVEHLRALGGLSEEVLQYPELLASVLPLVRAGVRMYELLPYVPERPLHCPITALAGDQDDEVRPEQLEAWAHHTTGPFALHWLAGRHFFVTSQEERVVHTIGSALAEALRG